MGMTMSAEAVEARKAYQREYRRKNRDKINSQRKNWRAENRDKVQRYNREYWERKTEKAKNIRASWEDYGITHERLDELMEIVRSGQHDDLVILSKDQCGIVNTAAYTKTVPTAFDCTHSLRTCKRGCYTGLRK